MRPSTLHAAPAVVGAGAPPDAAPAAASPHTDPVAAGGGAPVTPGAGGGSGETLTTAPSETVTPGAGGETVTIAPPPAGAADPGVSSQGIAHPRRTAAAIARSSMLSADESPRTVEVLGEWAEIVVTGSRDARIAAIAERQRGRVSRRQLLAAGLAASQVQYLLSTSRLFPEHAGVYAVGHPGEVPLGRETAALLASGGRALLAHASVAPVWDLEAVTPDSDVVHLLVDSDVHTRRTGIRSHRSRILERQDRRVRAGLPVSSPARMLLDLAAELTERTLERAFDQALVLGIVGYRDVNELLARAGAHRGRRALRDLAGEHATTVTRSEAEERLLTLVRAAGLPEPHVNVHLQGREVDFLWPEARLVVEVDGYRFHSSRAAFERDRVRDARMRASGIEVIRITWRRMERDPFAVVADIAGALARRMSPQALALEASSVAAP